MGFVGNDNSMGLFDRRENRCQIERHERPRIDDFHFDAFFCEFLGGLKTDLHGIGRRDQCDVAAFAFHIGNSERYRLVVVRDFTANIQQPGVIDKDGRVIAGDGGLEQAFYVAGEEGIAISKPGTFHSMAWDCRVLRRAAAARPEIDETSGARRIPAWKKRFLLRRRLAARSSIKLPVESDDR